MCKKIIASVIAVFALCVVMPQSIMAFNESKFTKQSLLSSGKWVKIAVSESGIHEISAEQLQEMGFDNPEKVAVYGNGGYIINEVMTDDFIDDLAPVSSLWQGNKLYFYAKNTVEMKLIDNVSAGVVFDRTRNPYSQLGYYFLTEEDAPRRVATVNNSLPAQSSPLTTSLNYWFHESELVSISKSGKDLLGEDMLMGKVNLPYSLPNIASTNIKVGARAACKCSAINYLVGSVTSGEVEKPVGFSLGDGAFSPITSTNIYSEWFYSIIMPYSSLNLNEIEPNGVLNLWLSMQSNLSVGKVDYAIITYNRLNGFAGSDEGSFDMWYNTLKSTDVIKLTDVDSDVMVWNVTNGENVVNYQPQLRDDSYQFTLSKALSKVHLVAFSPARTQKAIDSWAPVENQNLHGIDVPDMLIVTCTNYLEQAARIAQLHQEYDGMKVEVVDQLQVFNEFSSGTPDAMAIRLFCKMLYDRNPSKFKNLLIMGAGVYDNRGIVQFKENTVLTYESNNSHDAVSSYVCDDFYGMLDDGSGASIESAQLRLGVGRIPSASVQEAKSDVDKLVNYVANPDYGVWRNNFLLMADEGTIPGMSGDIGLHVWQAEGVNSLIENTTVGMHSNKVYVETFARDASETAILEKKRSCPDGTKHIIESLNAGQYFMSYIGHAGGSVMAGGSKLWRSSDVLNNNYAHLPIMSTACCDVARYDSNNRGIAEVMFHKPDGGVIALLTPARDVVAKYNDILNRAFVTAMFSTDNDGNMPTLGEAYKNAKLSFGTLENSNKMSFFLMGDPAIKINYPRPLFNVSKINGAAPSGEVTVSPLQQLTVEAQVLMKGTTMIDRSFNGDATLTLYGPSNYFTSYTWRRYTDNLPEKRDIMLERPQLARVEGKVKDGIFTATIIVPQTGIADGNLQLSLYAHKTGTAQMVNGVFNNIKMGEYDETVAMQDTQSPIIESMYLNDESSFAANATVGENAMLYVVATDDLAINTEKNTPGQTMRLTLDGNKEVYYTIKDYVVSSDQGRRAEVAFPLHGLMYGHHTLTFTVFDVAGNSTTRSIDFIVGQSNDLELDVDETPASSQVTFNIARNSLSAVPQVDVKVTDAQGRLVWKTTTSTFPLTWDLKADNGERVPAGLYKYFGTYSSDKAYGGTDIKNIIVINPLEQ